MNVRTKQREKDTGTPDLEFTLQLARALHLTPEAADEWLGVFLVRYGEKRRAALLAAAEQTTSEGRAVATRDKSCERAAA